MTCPCCGKKIYLVMGQYVHLDEESENTSNAISRAADAGIWVCKETDIITLKEMKEAINNRVKELDQSPKEGKR